MVPAVRAVCENVVSEPEYATTPSPIVAPTLYAVASDGNPVGADPVFRNTKYPAAPPEAEENAPLKDVWVNELNVKLVG